MLYENIGNIELLTMLISLAKLSQKTVNPEYNSMSVYFDILLGNHLQIR